jgi:tetratricopeptide (TPR) repeat protein
MHGDSGPSAGDRPPDISDQVIEKATLVTADATVAAAKAAKASTRVAVVSTLVSLVALVVAVYSVSIAQQENDYAERQSLLSLVTNIAQEPQLIAQAAVSLKASSTQLHDVDVQIQLSTLGEGEEADNLIQRLPNSAISSVEKYQVGLALEDGDDYQPALTLLTGAAREASDPRTAADAWREAARIYYTLGLNSKAEHDITLAEQAFNGPDVPQVSIENSLADTEFFDVQFQVFIKCSAAMKEWDQGIHEIGMNPSSLSIPLKIPETTAKQALVTTCHVPARTLKEVPAVGRP